MDDEGVGDMTATAIQPERRNPLPMLVVVGAMVFLAAWVIVERQHAIERHGVDALNARECLKRYGVWQI